MKVFCGTDIIEIDRIKEAIERSKEKFINEIYTPKEIDYCESKKVAKYEHYAARFAAKEAAFKAISNLLEKKFDIGWKDIEITNQESGRPQITFKNTNLPQITSIDISISHCKLYAIANVTILYEEGK